MVEEIKQIPLGDLVQHPGNRKIGGYDQAKLEQLAESIRAVGVQQPAVVRPAPDGKHEIVAGHRRLLAARLAGLETLPCVVRDLDDITVLKIQTIENLQREDVHPLDEADGYARLIEVAKYDVPTIAHELGKSASYVYQRLKLRELVPEARELLEDGTIVAGHAIQIARLQPAQQKETADWIVNGGEDPSTRVLGQFIEQEFFLDLAKAGFKKDDANLVPEAGACTACPKRTGYEPALFEDLGEDDRCLDRACFRAKLDAVVERKRKELDGKPHLEVLGGYDPDESRRERKKDWIESWRWQECKKKDEGAVPVLYVTGPERGRTTWGKVRKREQVTVNPEYEQQRKERKEKAKAESAARRELYDQVSSRAIADGDHGELGADVLALLRVGVESYLLGQAYKCHGLAKAEGWKAEKTGQGSEDWKAAVLARLPVDAVGLVTMLIKAAMAEELEVGQWGGLPPRTIYAAADALGIPHPELSETVGYDDGNYYEPEEDEEDDEPLTDDEEDGDVLDDLDAAEDEEEGA